MDGRRRLPLDLLQAERVLGQARGAGQFAAAGALQEIRGEPTSQLVGGRREIAVGHAAPAHGVAVPVGCAHKRKLQAAAR